jgi:hypothetical protein
VFEKNYNSDKSQFNVGVQVAKTIQYYLVMMHQARMDNDGQYYHSLCFSLLSSLSQDMEWEIVMEYKKKLFELNNKIEELRNGEVSNQIPANIFNELYEFELEMRKYVKKYGYHTRYEKQVEEEHWEG